MDVSESSALNSRVRVTGNGRAAVVHGGVEAREVDVVEVCTQLTWPARILSQSDIEDRHGIACAALQGRIDHHYLSLRCVGGGHPSGFGLQRAYGTRRVGQDANDDDNKAPIVLPAATASRWEMITRHQASAFASGQARLPRRTFQASVHGPEQLADKHASRSVPPNPVTLGSHPVPFITRGRPDCLRHDLEAWVEGKEPRLIAVLCHRQDQVKLERRQRPLGIGNPGFALTVDWCEFQLRAPVARIALPSRQSGTR
jgi:hypothetical protein